MANCREQVYSNDYFDFIINTGNRMYLPGEVECVQPISQEHSIIYYPREGLAPLEISTYTYSSIPKCYGLLDQTALEVTGILRLQNQPALALKGNGVLVGFLDTGIDYQQNFLSVGSDHRGRDTTGRNPLWGGVYKRTVKRGIEE